MLRFLTAGESHGPSLSVIVEGLPAGLAISDEEISEELARRRLGFGRGPACVLSAMWFAHRRSASRPNAWLAGLGGDLELRVAQMGAKRCRPLPGAPSKKLDRCRGGHADLAGMLKYGFDDARDVLERASARETAARVVAGRLAKSLLAYDRRARS